MDSDLATSIWFVTARAVHFGAGFIALSLWIFDRFFAPADPRWQSFLRRAMLILIPLIFLSGLIWFAAVVVNMTGLPPGDALRSQPMQLVWTQTQFGSVWKFRSICWLAASLLSIVCLCMKNRFWRGAAAWLSLSADAVFVASLAWAGHGQDGNFPTLHLTVDVTHLLIASLWPAGLLPLAFLLWQYRKTQDWPAAARLVHRFSTSSLVCVFLLAVTGTANACFLLPTFSDLFVTLWGRLLILKVVLFLAMFCIGAVNMLRLKPRLDAPPVVAALQRNVLIEMTLATLVIVLVAILGTSAP